MISDRMEPTIPDAPGEPARTPGAAHADTLTHLLGLLPSPDHLRSLAAGGGLPMSDRPEARAGDVAASLGVPRALLNPLESLPQPLSIGDFKRQVHAVPAPHTTPAY